MNKYTKKNEETEEIVPKSLQGMKETAKGIWTEAAEEEKADVTEAVKEVLKTENAEAENSHVKEI